MKKLTRLAVSKELSGKLDEILAGGCESAQTAVTSLIRYLHEGLPVVVILPGLVQPANDIPKGFGGLRVAKKLSRRV